MIGIGRKGKMSCYLFGTFDVFEQKIKINELVEYAKNKDVYFWFSEKNIPNEIKEMCIEQNINGKMSFFVSSANQPTNSSDLLLPFDKYTNEELFRDKSRKFYKQCCKDNLSILFSCLQYMIALLKPAKLEIFLTEGYDNNFLRKKCTLNDMKEDIYRQIIVDAECDSSVYQIIH